MIGVRSVVRAIHNANMAHGLTRKSSNSRRLV
jgi:hypothetical protein